MTLIWATRSSTLSHTGWLGVLVLKAQLSDLENTQKQHYSPQNQKMDQNRLKTIHFRVGAIPESGVRNHAGAFFVSRGRNFTQHMIEESKRMTSGSQQAIARPRN